VDFLYMGRLAAYVCIVSGPATSLAPEIAGETFPRDSAQHSALSIPPESRIDPDELILGDSPVAPG